MSTTHTHEMTTREIENRLAEAHIDRRWLGAKLIRSYREIAELERQLWRAKLPESERDQRGRSDEGDWMVARDAEAGTVRTLSTALQDHHDELSDEIDRQEAAGTRILDDMQARESRDEADAHAAAVSST